jgi:hypothetical protein
MIRDEREVRINNTLLPHCLIYKLECVINGTNHLGTL